MRRQTRRRRLSDPLDPPPPILPASPCACTPLKGQHTHAPTRTHTETRARSEPLAQAADNRADDKGAGTCPSPQHPHTMRAHMQPAAQCERTLASQPLQSLSEDASRMLAACGHARNAGKHLPTRVCSTSFAPSCPRCRPFARLTSNGPAHSSHHPVPRISKCLSSLSLVMLQSRHWTESTLGRESSWRQPRRAWSSWRQSRRA